MQLEQALRALMVAIDAELEAAQTGAPMQSAAPVVAAASATTAGGPPETGMLVQHLARLLEEGDGAAIDVLERSASVLAAGLGVEVFQEVTEAAHQFDFEGALAVLEEAKGKLSA